MKSEKEVLADLGNVLTMCYYLHAKASGEDRKDLEKINQTAKDAIELIRRTGKELEFEKAFNGNLCEAIAMKRKAAKKTYQQIRMEGIK